MRQDSLRGGPARRHVREHLPGWCGFPWCGAAYPFGEIGGPVAAGPAGPVDGGLDVDAEQARQNRGGQVGCPGGERGVAGLPGLDSVLAEPAGQGLGCDGPCGRAAGEERAGAWVAGGVRGGGVELGADESGEPGREEDRDGIEPQARVGTVLLDVGVGEPGQARDELALIKDPYLRVRGQLMVASVSDGDAASRLSAESLVALGQLSIEARSKVNLLVAVAGQMSASFADHAVQMATGLGDAYDRSAALIRLLPCLGDTRQEAVFRRVAEDLAKETLSLPVRSRLVNCFA